MRIHYVDDQSKDYTAIHCNTTKDGQDLIALLRSYGWGFRADFHSYDKTVVILLGMPDSNRA